MKQTKKERPIVIAQQRFAAEEERLRGLGLKDAFTHIYKNNMWGSRDSVSGVGSTLAVTENLRRDIPVLLQRFGLNSMLDIPCGDFGWMSRLDLQVHYIGGDIVDELVQQNNARYATADGTRTFRCLDLTSGDLPQVDLVFCRDCLVHLSDSNIFRALANIKRSGSDYLLTTTFLEHDVNTDVSDGDWRLLNLRLPPFYFSEPLATLMEGCTEGDGAYADKALCLWRVADLP
jgi:hypothetical protein